MLWFSCTYLLRCFKWMPLIYDAIMKTYLYNFDPLKPRFNIVKLGFTRIYIILLISAQNIDCGYSLKPPRRGASNEYPQSIFWAEMWKISAFLSENFHFLVVKFSVYLNRHVFVMATHGKRPYAVCGKHRPRSACAFAQADQCLCCPFIETMCIIVKVDKQKMSRSDCKNVHAHLDRCSHMA